ncbi:spherulation-specific family 4 [mine drainage metagenome]|uniref:Spherulation-specific family 4 n=1 Tax=mine drainage metagenome TaxID=410659 RepID=A0A1J5Q207_9ZZZZ
MNGRRKTGRLSLRVASTLALTAMLAACGGGGSASPAGAASGAAATPVAAQRKPMGLLIPLYAYPLTYSGSGVTRVTVVNPAWTAVAMGAASVPTVAVINPSSGPAACSDPPTATLAAFQQSIAQLQAADVTVLGYVHTSYGQRGQALVLQDVQTYAHCYGVDGIFFDEVPNTTGDASYYAAVSSAARAAIKPQSGKPALVVINPGSYPGLAVAQTADITVMHESADLNLPPVPAALASLPPSRYAYMAYGIGQPVQAALSALFSRGIAYVDLTDQGTGGTDPWTNLATGYAGLVQAVQGLNQTLAP